MASMKARMKARTSSGRLRTKAPLAATLTKGKTTSRRSASTGKPSRVASSPNASSTTVASMLPAWSAAKRDSWAPIWSTVTSVLGSSPSLRIAYWKATSEAEPRVRHEHIGQGGHVVGEVQDVGALQPGVDHGLAARADDRHLAGHRRLDGGRPASRKTSSTSSPCLVNRPASCATQKGAAWPPTVNQATLRGTSGGFAGASAAAPRLSGAAPGAAGAQASASPSTSQQERRDARRSARGMPAPPGTARRLPASQLCGRYAVPLSQQDTGRRPRCQARERRRCAGGVAYRLLGPGGGTYNRGSRAAARKCRS